MSLARTKRRNGFPSCFGAYLTLMFEKDGQEHYEALPCRRCNA
jgi:hypothetical protein